MKIKLTIARFKAEIQQITNMYGFRGLFISIYEKFLPILGWDYRQKTAHMCVHVILTKITKKPLKTRFLA